MRRTPGSVPSPPSQCGVCGRSFSDGERISNVLTERPDGGWERRSFCLGCAERGESEGFLCRWTSVYAERPKPRKIPADMAGDLLAGLLEREEWAGAANLLAWHLVRKRALRHLDTFERDGRSFNTFALPRGGREFEVPFTEPGEEDRERFFDLLDALDAPGD